MQNIRRDAGPVRIRIRIREVPAFIVRASSMDPGTPRCHAAAAAAAAAATAGAVAAAAASSSSRSRSSSSSRRRRRSSSHPRSYQLRLSN